jgi:hypothetical protein
MLLLQKAKFQVQAFHIFPKLQSEVDVWFPSPSLTFFDLYFTSKSDYEYFP